MNCETGEIRKFESEIPADWIGLEKFEAEKEIDLHGLRFKIVKSFIRVGKPGRISLELEGVPIDPYKEAFGDMDQKSLTSQGFNTVARAFRERAGKKDYER